ncbi:MAG: plastocyanin/azurin family copper-binding protein [Gemmatimonadales bacterium]
MTSLVAGLAMVLAACGGEKKSSDQPAAAPEQPGAPAATSTAAGATHDVNMELDGSNYKYVPSDLTAGPNDVIRFHNKSGGPHNVSFWADSIPSGAASHIVLPDPMAPLASKLVVAPDEVLEVKLNEAPKGDYKFYCTPHLALGMKGKLTVK